MNDTSWRSLSAILGVACVILIIAAGALLATSSGSPAPSSSEIGQTSAVPSGSDSSESSGPSASASATASAANNASGTARTITFVTDGVGPVGIAVTKISAKASLKICAKVDDSKPDCRTWPKVNSFKGASTDTAHSIWVITLIGVGTDTPTVDVAFSWPTNDAKITLSHGRLQGSSSPGVPEALNGFTCTFKTRAAGNVTVAASWTLLTADIDMSTADVDGPKAISLDEKQFKAAQNLGTPGYSFGLDAGKYFRVFMRSISADSLRPDLTAVISFP